MPHITLRHSDNLNDRSFIPFFKDLHSLLVNNLGVKLTSCSSTVIPHSQYLVGDGDYKNAFIHLEIKVKPNIDKIALDTTGAAALEMLKHYIGNSTDLEIKISVDCLEVTKYFKS